MKRKFILLAMMLLTLMGGVKFNVLNAQIDLTKQYRLKVNEGGYAGKYLHVNSFYAPNNQPQVGIAAKAENTNQIFTLEDAGNGNYYLKCATNDYYIKCAVGSQWWCVYAYSTTEKTPLYFHYTDGTNFYLRDYDKMMGIGGTDAGLTTDNYFKVENNGVYCDASPNYNSGSNYNANTSYVTTWSLEEVVFSVAVSADATEIWSDETVNLTAVATDGAGSYTYSWSPATGLDDATSASPIFTPTEVGTYTFTCTATDANDATATSEEISILVKDVKDKPAIQDIEVGDGSETINYLPTYTYYGNTISQQIYTAADLALYNSGNSISGKINKIAFNVSNNNSANRKVDVYMINTTKTGFSATTDWISMTDDDLVYRGEVHFANGWVEISLDNDFIYEGDNILLCVNDITNSYTSWGAEPYFYRWTPNGDNASEYRTLVGYKDNVNYDAHNFSGVTATTRQYFVNQIKFTVEVSTDPTVEVNPASLDFGTVRAGGDFWTEKEIPSFDVNVTAKNTTIASISCDNDFFTFTPALSGAAEQPEFNFTVSYDKEEAEAGDQTGTITVKYMDGEEEKSETISLSATAYVPAQGDVIENPFVVTFDENGTYTNTPTFANMKDDYSISGETDYGPEGNNPDAVYKLVLEEKSLMNATVDVGSWTYVYDADFGGEGGPKVGNQIYNGLSNIVLEAGTYYVVVATNGTFTFTMTASSVPAPEISYSSPMDESANNVNPELTWNMKYAETYKVMLGTSEDALEEVAAETAIEGQTEYSYQTENLQDNTKYYWQVVATNKTGTTIGEVQSFVTMLPAPQNVVASDYELKAGESTTISWDAVEGALSYKVYNAGELIATLEPTVTEYELTGLEYNMSGHSITVTAVHELGESYPGYATIKVAGSFTLAVSVKDANGNPIEDATVAIDMTNAYDEFQNQITETVTVEATDNNGNTTVTLPLLYQNDYIYDYYIGYIYPHYTVKVSKYPYTENTKDVYYNYSTSGWYINYIQNNDTYNVELSLTLPEVSGLRFTEEGDEVGPVVMKDSTIDLEWDEVEDATAYKVYTYNHLGEQIGESEIVTETSCEISTAEYNMDGFKYGVSALFNDIETSQAFTELIKVTGCGTITGIVKDGKNPVSNIIVHLEGESSIGNEVCPDLITNELGKFEFDEITEGTYTLTISHYDYVEYVRENIEILYGQPTDLGTIILTAKPTAAGITNVTATADGDNANVSWTVGSESSYTKYNVYRRNVEDPQELETIEQNVEATSYTDASWAELEPGTYQYGVAALVEPRGTEVIFEEGFEDNGTSIPTGWTNQNGEAVSTNFEISQKYVYDGSYTLRFKGGSGGFTRYLVTPEISIKSEPTLRFYYKSGNYYNYSGYNEIYVKVKGSDDTNWSNVGTITGLVADFEQYEFPLKEKYIGEKIQIQFECKAIYGGESFFDNIQVFESIPLIETQIVWSNDVEKKAPVMFYAYEDTDWNNPNNWNVKRLPTAEDEVVILTSVNISSEANAKSLNIASGSIVTVDENGVLNVAAGITNNGSFVLNDGGQIFQNNANIYAKFNMGIENPTSWSEETSSKDGWQFISSPFNAAQISLFTGLFTPKSYDLYKYDGTQDLEWINHKSETEFEETFVNGRGYLASYETLTSVELAGYLYYAKSFTWDNLTHTEKDLANFHLLGNPFTFDMDMTAATYNNLVEGVAIVNNEGGYTYDVTTIPVGDGFFVKATGENPTLSYDAEAKATRGVKANSLNVIATSNAGKDNVVINLGGEKAGFDKLQNFNDAIATVYVAEDGKNYGIYNCDADVQEIELNFNANQMGNYTISIQPNGKFQTVTLVDRFTGIETNMLLEDYSFTAMSNENNNRFIVKLAVSDQQSAVSDNFVYQSGEDLIIDAEGTVQIIDVMGRVLLSDEVESTNNRINVSSFRNGTYMVRVINGSEVKVEKVVIY